MAAVDAEIAIIVEDDVPIHGDPDDLTSLARFALAEEAASGHWEINVALCSDASLRRLHDQFMGIDSETDVMTFPAAEFSASGGGGDIAISVDRAAEQAPEWGQSAWDEIRFLAVHGVLHLCGWVDESPSDRKRMLARQREIIDRFDRQRRDLRSDR